MHVQADERRILLLVLLKIVLSILQYSLSERLFVLSKHHARICRLH